MIDFVRLGLDISLHHSQMKRDRWHKAVFKDGTSFYCYIKRNVKVFYYPNRERLIIHGKLVQLFHDTQVLNVDDLYGADLQHFIDDVNGYLNRLFTHPLVDIRDFMVLRMDYCFNVSTPHVQAYISFLNAAFTACNRGQRVNYVQENGLDGSVYVKTKADYKANVRRNYVLNFYDKADRLRYQKASGCRVTAEDEANAQNILRLEVQCGYQFLKRFCKSQRIKRTFGELLSYQVAYAAEKAVYERVFCAHDMQDFYAYDAAKALLPRSSAAAYKTLYHAATHHSIRGAEHDYGRSVIRKAGVYPFCFLPRQSGLSILENPLKLIQRKMQQIGVEEQSV